MTNSPPLTSQAAPNIKSVSGRRNPVHSKEVSTTYSPHIDVSSGEPRMTRIAKRAHELYEARGRNGGRDIDDWLQAEREIDGESDNQQR